MPIGISLASKTNLHPAKETLFVKELSFLQKIGKQKNIDFTAAIVAFATKAKSKVFGKCSAGSFPFWPQASFLLCTNTMKKVGLLQHYGIL